MENQKKSAIVRITVIIFVVSAMLLSASPCVALIDVSGETTLDVDYPINDDVAVYDGGILNLLDGGLINGAVGIGDGGVLNMKGGYISSDVYIAGGSEVNIKGGDIEGDIYPWDMTVEAEATVTVFGTDFNVTNGTIDPSGAYFTPYTWPPCLLTGKYGGDAGDIDLLFYVFSNDVHIFLAPPASEVIIDIKPGGNHNSINLRSKGVVSVAILATDGFLVDMIDPSTVDFAGAEPVRWNFRDVDDDGDEDIIFHFRTQDLALDKNSTEATLTACLLNGDEVSGTDGVRIVPSKK